MKKSILLFSCLLLLLAAVRAQQTTDEWRGPQSLETLHAARAALIPFPQEVHWNQDNWPLPTQLTISFYPDESDTLKNAVLSLQEILAGYDVRITLSHLREQSSFPVGGILLRIDKNITPVAEGYQLSVTPNGITIIAKDAAGAFYAVQTFKQLLQQKEKGWELPQCSIRDWPAFGLRGFMHDNGRNFQSVSALKLQLDQLSAYKFNTFHWHLTDNPAWRPQSKLFPQLNDPANRKAGRDPDSTYSFAEILDLIQYAKAHCIQVIPELDMPGHSAYFQKTFGFKMGTEEGITVLEKLIDEFCAVIPAADCPILHIGSDEVHIPHPDEFMKRIAARVRANRRTLMVWNPGLKGDTHTIEQRWIDGANNINAAAQTTPFVDSYVGYLNSGDVLSNMQRYFFQQPCNRVQGDSVALGGILCCWPDVRVDDKKKILLYNGVWPCAITYSEALWCGRPGTAKNYMEVMPPANTTPGQYFQEFEKRLAWYRDHFFARQPFPFVAFSNITWQMTGPYKPGDAAFAREKGPGPAAIWQRVTGGVLLFESLLNKQDPEKDTLFTVYVRTFIYSNKPQQMHAWVGFEMPARSNRQFGGIPAQGQWDANGGNIWINNQPVPAPQWLQPGANRYLQATWETPASEIPYTDEEFYWTRTPAAIPLKKGWNTILMRVPHSYKYQNHMCAFVPVKADKTGRWVEDNAVKRVGEKR
ncbi:glycosyl hydrolase family 20 [Chitinophaga niastensis]|uniref:beta-N-acetylhexosaminidase n=1 Tax=Chitinophaga niastensis TaxID=536980 RepID=A0A2P8HQ33_CHINA|nr:beta-N-acetylhexosaminidase [Chitinophaga niastensis]PSL48353.1 glycosyl hydrolase family 20 [Chitinophaga niastensis]